MLSTAIYKDMSMPASLISKIPMLYKSKITGIKTGIDSTLRTVFCPDPNLAIAAIKLNAPPIPPAPNPMSIRKEPANSI